MEVKTGLLCQKLFGVLLYVVLSTFALIIIIKGPVESVIRQETMIRDEMVKVQGVKGRDGFWNICLAICVN